MPDPAAQLRIRMYHVGFGDAFLLFIPTDDGERTMLVDCGVHPSGVANTISTVVKDIIRTVTVDGKARLDVVVATHRHFDHISGFGLKAWRDVEVGEVWLPWTEERGNPRADAIRHTQHRLAAALTKRFGVRTTIGAMARNSFSNEDSEQTLLKGFTGAPLRAYLPQVARDERTFLPRALPGVTVHAIGPSHDPDVVALLDPPGAHGFPFGPGDLAADDPELVPRAPTGVPLFNDRFVSKPSAVKRKDPERWARADTAKLQEAAEYDYFAAASSLEDSINGTSLVLMLEVGKQRVLLAGDAEWGTWSEALADDAWRNLLRRTTIYKVSHHGSWNGTPTDFVHDLLSKDALSLMSFKDVDRWPSIPRDSLTTALAVDERVLVRSDKKAPADPRITRTALWTEVAVPVG